MNAITKLGLVIGGYAGGTGYVFQLLQSMQRHKLLAGCTHLANFCSFLAHLESLSFSRQA